MPVTQKSVSVETRSKVQPDSQASKESDKEVATKTEPRRIKIFDGGYEWNSYRTEQSSLIFLIFHFFFSFGNTHATVLPNLPHRYKSNEEYVYVRGRGRGKYICEECGIRCKKPSMLRKHIRTHSDVRPYHCVHCNFSFKTKGWVQFTLYQSDGKSMSWFPPPECSSM